MFQMGATRIVIKQGDITNESVDAIVNAANEPLVGGGGVDGAIHRAGGPDIMRECAVFRASKGGCPTGSAVATTAGKLDARFVFHAVGPIWNDATADECCQLLASAYRTCLKLAAEKLIRTIAFPSISTGVYGFPIERAAPIVFQTLRELLPTTSLEEVRFLLFSAPDFALYNGVAAGFATSSAQGR